MPLTRAELDARIDTLGYPDEAPDGTTVQGATIEGHVWDIYKTKAGQKMIDDWLTGNPTENIQFTYKAGKAHVETGDLNTGKVSYDLEFNTANGDFVYLDKNGVAVDEQDVGTIAHELGHALTTNIDKDWSSQSDYTGSNVTPVNEIFKELGLNQQISYPAATVRGNLVAGTDYSDGKGIDRAWVDSSERGAGNHTSTGNHRDLLVGGASNNTFNAGDGNDIMHGQGGIDKLKGEAGDDLIFGGADADIIDGGIGNDVLYGGDKTTNDSGAADTLTGGTGDDIYHVGDNDIIMADKDGAGDKIFLDGVKLTGPGAGGLGADGASYALSGDTLTVTRGGSSITINDFDEGKFGFEMAKAAPAKRSAGIETQKASHQDGTTLSPDIKELPIEDAITVLKDESDEALRIGAGADATDPVTPMLNSPAAMSVMKTLVENDQATIPVSQDAMNGNAFDRVQEVLRGSVDRLEEIEKTHEAEAMFLDQKSENLQSTYAHESTHQLQPSYEDEMSQGL